MMKVSDIWPRLGSRLATSQLKHPGRHLAVFLAVTIVAGYLASGLKFDSSYEALLPKNAPEVQNIDDVRLRTGGTRQLVVAIGGDDEQSRLEFGRQLASKLRAIDNVRFVDLEFSIDFFKERGFWLLGTETLDELIPALEEAVRVSKWQANPMALHLDEEAEKKELEEAWGKVDDVINKERGDVDLPYDEVLTSEDGKYTFLLVIPTIKFTEMDEVLALLGSIEKAASSLGPESRGLEVRYAGNLKVIQEQHKTMGGDLRRASIVALIFGVLLVAGFTRKPLAPLLVGAALVAGVLWTFAVTRLLIGHVNIITGFLVAVLIGLGIDFGIHLYLRFVQELEATKGDVPKAIADAIGGTLPPAVTSALTTAGTFLSFSLADFRGFSEFGIIAGIGVLLTLTSSFVVLPPLLVLTSRAKGAMRFGRKRSEGPSRLKAFLKPGLAGALVAVFATAAFFGVYGSSQLRFRNDFKQLRGVSEATEFLEYVDQNMGVGFNPAVFLASSVDDAQGVVDVIDAYRAHKEGDESPSRIGKVISVSDLLPRDLEARGARINKLHEILDDPKLDRAEKKGGKRAEQLKDARKMAASTPWSFGDLPEQFKRRFSTVSGDEYLVFVWPEAPNYIDHEVAAWEDELLAISSALGEKGIEHSMADETLIIAWVYRLIVKDGPRLLVVAAFVVLFFLILDFRKPRYILLVFLPLSVGMLIFVGMLHAIGVELNMFNMVVLPSIVGIGIDNAVHIFHRYKTEGVGSVPLVLKNTGQAALLASLTTGVGFGSAIVSHHAGLKDMGTVAVVGIGATFLAAVVFFPSVLILLERKKRSA